MVLTKQELSQANNRKVFSIIDLMLGIHSVKRGVFSIRSDDVALDQRPDMGLED